MAQVELEVTLGNFWPEPGVMIIEVVVVIVGVVVVAVT